MNIKLLAAMCLGAGLLAACGGGDDDYHPPAPLTEVPASAGASAEAYTNFGVAQAAAASETDEPLGTDLIVTPPTSETAEPAAL